MENRDIYQDISNRCQGTVYVGVTGPVRTGKSTLIRQFMEVFVLPNMRDENMKKRLIDEMPQSGDGKTVTTVEPKFIPAEPAEILMDNGTQMTLRMVDCVGYIIPGVLGIEENGKERMVKTPWSSEKMTFTKAAEIGTEKVINDHSVVGVVVTSDGSFGNIPREMFIEAEEKTVNNLKLLNKPFIVVLNSSLPDSRETILLAQNLSEIYKVPVLPFNCQRMTTSDFETLFNQLLLQFPASEIRFILPEFLRALPTSHWIKKTLTENVKKWMGNFESIGEVVENCQALVEGEVIEDIKIEKASLSDGMVILEPALKKNLYYKVIEEIMGTEVNGDGQLFKILKDYAAAKCAYDGLKDALIQVERGNYGIVAPELEEMILDKPEVFKQGSKYGVRMTAKAPCLHIIKTDISTEIAPLVGSESQSADLAEYLAGQMEKDKADLWETSLFGKTLREMVIEQMENKVNHVPENVRGKVQKSLQRISDDGKDYFVCIIF